MTEPTDDEIMELAKPFITRVGSHWENDDAIPDNGSIEDFARAVFARWGAPAAVGEPDAFNRRLRAQLEQEWADLKRLQRAFTAPPTQPAARMPLTTDQCRALREANCIASEDGYFAARPQIDSNDRRKVFQAGFERGWDAARKQGANHD